MGEQLSKPLCQLVGHKIYVKNIQESNKASASKRDSFVDKPSKKGAKTVASDTHDFSIQQDLKLFPARVPKSRSSNPFIPLVHRFVYIHDTTFLSRSQVISSN